MPEPPPTGQTYFQYLRGHSGVSQPSLATVTSHCVSVAASSIAHAGGAGLSSAIKVAAGFHLPAVSVGAAVLNVKVYLTRAARPIWNRAGLRKIDWSKYFPHGPTS